MLGSMVWTEMPKYMMATKEFPITTAPESVNGFFTSVIIIIIRTCFSVGRSQFLPCLKSQRPTPSI